MGQGTRAIHVLSIPSLLFLAFPSFQIEDRAPFRKVYYVSSSRDLNQVDWETEFNGHSINLPVICNVKSRLALSNVHSCVLCTYIVHI